MQLSDRGDDDNAYGFCKELNSMERDGCGALIRRKVFNIVICALHTSKLMLGKLLFMKFKHVYKWISACC